MESANDNISKGTQFLEEGDFENALSCFEKALKERPNDPDILNKKGVTLRSMGRYQEAIQCFNQALEIDPRDKNAS